MRTDLQTGASLADRLMGLAALILSFPDLEAMRSQHGRIIHRLQGCLERAKLVRLRTGRAPQLDGLDWLSRVVQDHPAFERLTPDSQAMQRELQTLVVRIGRGA